jgi:hypothetical protein
VRGPGSERPVDELPGGGPPHRHGRIPAEKSRARRREINVAREQRAGSKGDETDDDF